MTGYLRKETENAQLQIPHGVRRHYSACGFHPDPSPPSALSDNRELLENFWHDQYGGLSKDTKNYVRPPSLLGSPEGIKKPDSFDPSIFSWKRLAKAKPDECFYGIGDPRNRGSFFGSYGGYSGYPADLVESEIDTCLEEQGIPKVNQAYVWGLTKSGHNLWFGTVANTLCLVLDSFGFPTPPHRIDNDWVCEMDGKDLRPPRIFVYDTKYKLLIDRTQEVIDKGDGALLLGTAGLRSAGTLGKVVFLGGISANGVNLFAFHAGTLKYLGAKNFPEYNNVRQWRVIKNHLYVGMGTPGPGPLQPGGGEILRWKGNVWNPFQFEKVGILQADPAYLAEHKGRIFVSTWGAPGRILGSVLYMSPLIGFDRKLNRADKDNWEIVWSLSDYEVERAAMVVGGAIASYGPYLYWGTMSVPGAGISLLPALHPRCGAPEGIGETVAAFLGTYRPVALFRGKDFGKETEKVELLYGTTHLPKLNDATCQWEIVPNNMGEPPRYGLAGINNFFNNYLWWMERHRGKLFVGSMDFLYVAGGFLRSSGIQIPERLVELARHFEGADLYSFVSNNHPAFPISLDGLGNYLNYGIRTMVADDFLYLGTANPMNLATDPNDNKPEGGWELYKLKIDYDFHAPGIWD